MGSCSNARIIHSHTITSGFNARSFILNSIIDVYAKFGRLHDARWLFEKRLRRDVVAHTTLIAAYWKHGQVGTARELFDGMLIRDVVSYNAIISGHVQNGQGYSVIQLFLEMARIELRPDDFTFTSVLSASGSVTDRTHGCRFILRWLKLDLDELCLLKDEFTWITVLTGYGKSGNVEASRQLFDGMTKKFHLACNAIIAGYAQFGCYRGALELFANMLEEWIKLDEFTFTSILSAFANCRCIYCLCDLGALRDGYQLYSQLIQLGLDSSISAGIALADSVSWNAMIAALGQHGYGEEALNLFEQMLHEGIEPDRITFLTVLSVCSHAGLVEEGCKYFKSMGKDYGIKAWFRSLCKFH
ncbi:pentatricopeptide repeat-containing protein At1g25360-like [Nymphaea colorata]|nr:pentatricopeptide repeat-containing protein At1g25360-like [Nymphaea colorata]